MVCEWSDNIGGESKQSFAEKCSLLNLMKQITGEQRPGILLVLYGQTQRAFMLPVKNVRIKLTDYPSLILTVKGGWFMDEWISEEVKIQLRSTNHGVLKQLHLDIADKVLALQRNTLAWTGGHDMNVHGAQLTTALEKMIATCGGKNAKTRSHAHAKQYAPLIGTYLLESRLINHSSDHQTPFD